MRIEFNVHALLISSMSNAVVVVFFCVVPLSQPPFDVEIFIVGLNDFVFYSKFLFEIWVLTVNRMIKFVIQMEKQKKRTFSMKLKFNWMHRFIQSHWFITKKIFDEHQLSSMKSRFSHDFIKKRTNRKKIMVGKIIRMCICVWPRANMPLN